MANQIQTRPNPRGRLLFRFLALSTVATTLLLLGVFAWYWVDSRQSSRSSIDWKACGATIQANAEEAGRQLSKTAGLVAARTTSLVKMVTAKEPLKPSVTIDSSDPLQEAEFKRLALTGTSTSELKALDEASGALAAQIARFPDDASLHNRIGMIYSSLGDLTMATSHFQKAVDLCRAQIAIARAEEAKLRASGQTQAACEKLLLASKLSVDLEAAHSSLARVFDKLGEHDKVVAQLDQLNRDLVFGSERPQRAISSIMLGTSTASSERAAREAETAAAAALRKATAPPVDKEEHQLNERTLRLLARAQGLMQARRLPEAEQAFKQVVVADPLAAAPHEELGNIYLQCSNYGMAIQEFERASVLDPDNGTVYSALAAAYQATGEVEHAVAMYGKSLTLRPKDAEVAFNLGTLLASQGKYQEAEDALRKAVENNPKLALAHNHLGSIMSLNGDYKNAAVQFKEAVQVAPDMASAHYGLGLALYHLKNYAASIPEFKRAVALNPSLIDCHNKIERAYRKAGLAQGPVGMN